MEKQKHTKQSAGQKGGRTTLARYGPEHMRTIGSRGAAVTWERHYLAPVNESQYAMVRRSDNVIVAIR